MQEILYYAGNNGQGGRAKTSPGGDAPATRGIESVRIVTKWNWPRLARRAVLLACGAVLSTILNLFMLQDAATWCLLCTAAATAFTLLSLLKDWQGRASHGWANYTLQVTGGSGPVEVASSASKAYLQALVSSGMLATSAGGEDGDPDA